MGQYLTSERIKAALSALSDTRAKASLLDFLIVKRSLAVKQPLPTQAGLPTSAHKVAITQGEPAYIQAVAELARVAPPASLSDRPYFNVFAQGDAKGGYRGRKFISNGTGSTIGGSTWRAILDLDQVKPRQASLASGYVDRLEEFFLRESLNDPKPPLGELAIWTFREADLSTIFGAETDPVRRGELLSQEFKSNLGLTSDEIGELFDSDVPAIADHDLGSSAASPHAYLADVGAQSVAAASPQNGACARDLAVALAAKPFVIVTGTSGTGKSRSALLLAEQLQAYYSSTVDEQIFQLVAIGPDWTSPKKLLGYRTPFGAERVGANGAKTNESYEITETLRVILRAANPKSTKVPHFLIFDEMNLSHVERYFAPFLSLMEASNILEDGGNAPIVDRHSIVVISEMLNAEDPTTAEAESAKILAEAGDALTLPPNLFYIGTVNVDETTYMFSPKVLDRAHVLEIRPLTPSDYARGTAPDVTVPLAVANSLLREAIDDREAAEEASSGIAHVFDPLATKHGVDAKTLAGQKKFTLDVLDGCFHILAPVGFEFAYRVVKEVHDYLLVWTRAQLANGASPESAMETWIEGLDRAVLQKVLPKIHGSRTALGDSLKALAAFLSGQDATGSPAAKYSIGTDRVVQIAPEMKLELPDGQQFSLSVAKLLDMHAKLSSRNYVSFVK